MATTKKQPTRLASMAKVRKLRQAMSAVFSLANAALAYADKNYTTHPQSGAVRLAVTFCEIAALIPKEAKCHNRK